jgi:hypothetical protein
MLWLHTQWLTLGSTGHAFLAQFGRIARRLDRLSKRFLGWVQLAASIIFLRAQAHGFFRPRTLLH